MDKLTNYRNIINAILSRHAEQIPSIGQVTTTPVFDEQNGNYRVVDMGWDLTGRVHWVSAFAFAE